MADPWKCIEEIDVVSAEYLDQLVRQGFDAEFKLRPERLTISPSKNARFRSAPCVVETPRELSRSLLAQGAATKSASMRQWCPNTESLDLTRTFSIHLVQGFACQQDADQLPQRRIQSLGRSCRRMHLGVIVQCLNVESIEDVVGGLHAIPPSDHPDRRATRWRKSLRPPGPLEPTVS